MNREWMYRRYNDQGYISGKSKRIAEEYEAQIAGLSQSMPDGVQPTPEDHASIFVGVAQDPAKHRVFGLGSLYQPRPSSSSASSAFNPAGSSSQYHTQEEFDARIREVRQEIRGELRGMVQAEVSDLQKTLQEQLEQNRQQNALINRLLQERDTPPGWN